ASTDVENDADCGIARAVGSQISSASSSLLGTVAYISPEVVTRCHSDERSDLYSLGVVLCEMLTGRQPFVGEQPVHIAVQHVHEDIPAPSTLVSGIPRELDSLVTWAAARVAEQPPASATGLPRAGRGLSAARPAALARDLRCGARRRAAPRLRDRAAARRARAARAAAGRSARCPARGARGHGYRGRAPDDHLAGRCRLRARARAPRLPRRAAGRR